MPLAVTTTGPERAIETLAAAIADAKGVDVLEPVVVAVPSNTCGVMTRRALGRTGGIAGVDMVTLDRLAELLAGPVLAAADRSPLSTPVIDLAVAEVLADDPGPYAAVASHPSTVVALRDLHRELRRAGPDAAAALADHSRRGRESVRVSRAVTRRLERRWYDDADLFGLATDLVRDGAPSGLRHLIVHLPRDLRGLPLAFVRELGTRIDVRLVATMVGDDAADAETVALLAALDLDPGAGPTDVAASRPPTRIVSTTDADDEVRTATRLVLDAARAGTPFERIAVLWPLSRPYARLVEHHLDVAEIPWNGRPGTTTTERLAPRLVLDLLDVDRRGLRRRDLFALLADVPARAADGSYLPTAEWERVSREAGVARDDDWHRRLGALHGHERWGDAADGLAQFVDGLRDDLGHPAATARWWDWAVWCDEQLERWIGRRTLERLPEPEHRAWEALTRALDRLRHLDPVGPPVTRHRFRATLEAELDDMPGRQGRVGDGVTVGPLGGAEGLDVDVVVVLGGAEGSLPPTPGSDPLLSDADRAAAGLPAAGAVADRLHRNLLIVCAGADVSITVPRGDLRATSHQRPSRWIAGWIDDPRLRVVASHTAGLASTEFPASAVEHRLRARLGHVMAGSPVETGADADDTFRRGLALRRARETDALTAYDGDLSGVPLPRLDEAVSPSRLETWAACPHAYFVHYLLGVRPIEEPDDEISITAADRGSATHDALDRFHRAVIAGELPQPTESGWSDEHREALGRYFDEVSAETERRGRTGRPAYWAVERERMRADLLTWLDHDSAIVAARSAHVVASEHRFDEDADVSIPLADGRRVQLKGSVDRVDRCADGMLVVTDHKTGRGDKFRGLGTDDPTLGGTAFQLPAYAAAARALSGDAGASVYAEYGLFARADYKRFGYQVDDEVWAGVQADLAAVVAGIESGYFPPRPERPGWRLWVPCEFCEPDHLGTAERWAEWDRKRHDPRLAPWFAPPAEEGDDR